MSIRGIDAQIMIARATDYQKDTSVQQKKNELMQDYLAAQSKVEEQHDKEQVAGTIQAQEANVTLSKDSERSGGGHSGGQNSGKQGDGEFEDPNKYLLDQLRTDNMYIIDIQV